MLAVDDSYLMCLERSTVQKKKQEVTSTSILCKGDFHMTKMAPHPSLFCGSLSDLLPFLI